jgi:uncharacterized protein YdiU (UPF0061 family)
MADDWDGADKKAFALLRGQGEIPIWRPVIANAQTTLDKAQAEYDKKLEAQRQAIREAEAAATAAKSAANKYQAELNKCKKDIASHNLGLDPKNKDDTPLIEKAREILLDRIDEKIDLSRVG